jgi:hypothetical protein
MKILMFRGLTRFVDQLPLNLSDDDILAPDDNSDRSSCSSMSLYSYDTERDGATLFYEASGRRYNSQNQLYLLPSDQSEFSRQ